MATRFWVGGTGTWSNTNTANWAATSGGTGGVSVPTASDDVTFDGNSNATSYTVTITGSPTCNNFNIANPASGTISLIMLPSIATFGSTVINTSGSNITNLNLNFSATATGKTITTNGNQIGQVFFSGVNGGWQVQDSMICGVLTHTAGTFDTNGKALTTTGTITSSGSTVRTLTFGASVISILNFSTLSVSGTNLTVNSGTSSITISTAGTGGGVQLGAFAWYDLSITLNFATPLTLAGASFHNLTLIGAFSSNLGLNFSFDGNFTVSNNLTASSTNQYNLRTQLISSVVGTPRTITCNGTVSMTNIDFQDITGAGSASWNLSAASGGSGDCGGNSGITFTTAKSLFWVGNGGDWAADGIHDVQHWAATSGGSAGTLMPLPQDTAIFDANSFTSTAQTVTVTGGSGNPITHLCKDINWTGATNSPTFNQNVGFSMYGSLTLISAMTLSTTTTITFLGRGSHTVTFAGNTANDGLTFAGFGGTYTLQDTFTTSNTVTVNAGTLNTNGKNFTARGLTTSVGATLNLTSSTVTVGTGSSGTICSFAAGTITAGTSTIVLHTTASSQIMTFGGNALWNFTVDATATTTVTIQGSNTFNTFFVDASANSRTIQFTAGTTQTATQWSMVGSSGKTITVKANINGTQYNLVQTTGLVDADWLLLRDSNVSGGAIWYYGTHTTDNGNNTGWSFRWTNPGNAFASDNTYATAPAVSGALDVYLSKDGGLTWQSVRTVTFTGTDTTLTYGAGQSELWGSSFTDVDVNNTNFRLRIQTGSQVQIYKTFGSTVPGGSILTGISVQIEANFAAATLSVDLINVSFVYGQSVIVVQPGSIAYASNGRKNGEGSGAGTGVQVFFDSASHWVAVDSGTTVAA